MDAHLGEVLDSINPHEGHHLPQGDPDDGEASSVSVHKVQDVLQGGKLQQD